MKNIGVLMFAVTAAAAVSLTRVAHEEWKAFKLEHRKQYDSQLEDQYRMRIYAENKRKVAKHNQLFALGLVGYSQGLNEYSDLTLREFVAGMTGYNGTRSNTATGKGQEEHLLRYRPPANWTPPGQVDWRSAGAVTEVKNQEMCRSCWAFCATGALEGQHFRRTGRLVSLSEQNLIDCSREYGTRGCRGGRMNDAFTYIRINKGVDTEISYPYEAMDDLCRYKPSDAGAMDAGFVTVPKNERTLQHAVASVGPVAAAMCGSLDSFRHYARGVYDDRRCAARRRDHGVLIVGYGREANGVDYWLVKNSWGLTWGMDGYGKIARNRNNLCGIASEASYPLV